MLIERRLCSSKIIVCPESSNAGGVATSGLREWFKPDYD
jgi:hypothetical protein